jgi:hypothetical protein
MPEMSGDLIQAVRLGFLQIPNKCIPAYCENLKLASAMQQEQP